MSWHFNFFFPFLIISELNSCTCGETLSHPTSLLCLTFVPTPYSPAGVYIHTRPFVHGIADRWWSFVGPSLTCQSWSWSLKVEGWGWGRSKVSKEQLPLRLTVSVSFFLRNKSVKEDSLAPPRASRQKDNKTISLQRAFWFDLKYNTFRVTYPSSQTSEMMVVLNW